MRGKSRVKGGGRERDSEENRDESDVDSDGEIDSESECEQSEDETFRNVGKFVEIEYEMEFHYNIIQLMCLLISFWFSKFKNSFSSDHACRRD